MKKTYSVAQIDIGGGTLSELAASGIWEQAAVLTDFASPWEDKTVRPIAFRALHDTEHLFFCFTVQDSEVHIDQTDQTHHSINNSDRVELFFKTDDALNPYYCLEIDPTPRVMDFKARPNKVFDFDWVWPPEHLDLRASIGATSFTVQGAISKASLRDLGLLQGALLQVGLYRAKYDKNDVGIYSPTWISWVDPATPTPNFHTASSFGLFRLEG